MRKPVSVLIPTHNEESNLPDCLAGVTWADEIFVVDDDSDDKTVELAEAAGARVVQHEYKSNAAQKNWAIPQCSHEWVLIVEADERCTPELRAEVEAILSGEPKHDAWWVYRQNFVWGQEIRHGGWNRDKAIRLIHRDKCRYKDRQVAPEIDLDKLDKPAGWLCARMPHYSYRTFDQFYPKFQRYTSWTAIELQKQGIRARWYHLVLNPVLDFLRRYVIQLGMLDGRIGLILAGQTACYVFVKYAKLWYMQNVERELNP